MWPIYNSTTPQIDLTNRPWPWINGQAQAFKVQEGYAHDDFESIDSKENWKTFEEDILNMKVSDYVAQSPNGAKLEVNMSLNSGFVEMKSYAHCPCNEDHTHAGHTPVGPGHTQADQDQAWPAKACQTQEEFEGIRKRGPSDEVQQ